VFDVETQVVLVYAPITQVNKGRLRLGANNLAEVGSLSRRAKPVSAPSNVHRF
jgi:hypothetical protein